MIEELIIATLKNAVMATVLAIVIATVARPNRHPRLTQMLWLLLLLKLVMPPIIEVPVMRIGNSDRDLQAGTTANVEHRTVASGTPQISETASKKTVVAQSGPQSSSEVIRQGTTVGRAGGEVAALDHSASKEASTEMWPIVVAVIWFGGALILFVSILNRCIIVARLVRRSLPASSPLKEAVDSMASKSGLGTTLTVRVSSAPIAPLVCSFGRGATLLLPVKLLALMTPEERSVVIRHELVHLRRHDHLLIWFELAIVCLYWWHPIAWIARRQSRRAAELCCDADVLANGQHSPETYSRALLKTLDFVSEGGQSTVVFASFLNGNVRHLKGRLEMILQDRKLEPLGIRTRLSIAFLTLAALVMTPVLLTADDKNQDDAKKDSPPSLRLISIDGKTMLLAGEGELPANSDVEVNNVISITAGPLPGSMKVRKGTYYAVDRQSGFFLPDDEEEDRKIHRQQIKERRATQQQKSIELRSRIEKLKKEEKPAETRSVTQELRIHELQMHVEKMTHLVQEQFEKGGQLMERIESLEKQVRDLSDQREPAK